jgi:hypothetical protein
MRIVSVVAAAGAMIAPASLGFAQSQVPSPPARAPLEGPSVSAAHRQRRAKRPEALRSVISSRNRKASSVPQPALTPE